jgi:lipopolysaccharide biosynthesis glycosyltransferase
LSRKVSIFGLELEALRERSLYTRPTEMRGGRLFDLISNHPMSTEFAISRFLVPTLAGSGWALFLDCDMLVKDDLHKLFALADPNYAVMCVKHQHYPRTSTKMHNQVQSTYPRKNWSSVCLFNCDHPANKRLTPTVVNSLSGRALHAFCWLEDEQIGDLGEEYNYLVGYSEHPEPKIVHFTEGTPDMPGYENCEYADEWRTELRRAARWII